MQETDIIMYDFTGINIHLIRIPVIESFLGSNMKQRVNLFEKKKKECNYKQENNKHIPINRINKNYKPSSIQNST